MTRDPRNLMWAEACTLLERAEQLRRQFFEPSGAPSRTARWEPPIDVLETERQLWIIAALPGVPPEAVHVTIEGETLIVAGDPPPAVAGPECQYSKAGDSVWALRAARRAEIRAPAARRTGAPAWLPRADLRQARLSNERAKSKRMNQTEHTAKSADDAASAENQFAAGPAARPGTSLSRTRPCRKAR